MCCFFYVGRDSLTSTHTRASLVAQMVKNPPAMRETWVQFLGWEDPLEEGMTIHSSILAWRIPMDRGTSWATVHGDCKELDTTEMTKHNTASTGGTIRLPIITGRQNTTHKVYLSDIEVYKNNL